MDFTHFTAGKDDSDRRLDRILRRFLSEENLSSLYKSLRKGLVKVNGKKCEGNFRISEGDDIQIADFLLGKNSSKETDGKTNAASNAGETSPLKDKLVIFRNDSLLILNKPYDIPVQPSQSSRGNSLAEIVQKDYEIKYKNNSLSFRTGPLHRLDRKTTGLIAFSQNLEGAKWFSEKIKTHEIQKIYIAVLEGKLEKSAVWEDYIQKIENGNRERRLAGKTCETGFERVSEQLCCEGKIENLDSWQGKFHTVEVSSSDDEGKFAHTEFFPVSYGVFEGKDVTLARILIKTGRTHQIRSQASFHGFPLLGDTAYGGSKIDSKRFGRDFFLHAYELHFPAENPLGLPEKIVAPVEKTLNFFPVQIEI